MQRSRMRRAAWLIAALVMAVAVAACGSSSNSTTTSSSGAPHKASSKTESGTGAPQPGKGKPAIVLGDENFEEEYLLGSLYQEALEGQGYTVTLKGNIGSAELTYKAFTSGAIEAYPEYTGTLLTAVADILSPPPSAQGAYLEAKQWLQKHGATMIGPTPFADSDAIGTTKKYAAEHHLTTIADLKPLGKSVTMGGLPEFQTRAQALVGLKKAYGINPTFVPLASGLFYNALDSGQVDTSDVFTTDPELESGKYVVLTDPKHVFGFQNVGLVVKQSVLTAAGPAFAKTITTVNNLLTQSTIIKLNAAVVNDKLSPAVVAQQFLKANGVL
jgi:osmoprotectant transport system substrate-binding protein